MKGKVRSTAILSGLLLLSLLFGCARVDAPTQLEVQKATVLSATFTEPVIKADIQGWAGGTYCTTNPEVMGVEAIAKIESRRTRIVLEIIGFRPVDGVVIGTLNPAITAVITRPSMGTQVGRWSITEVGCDHGAPCAAGIDVRAGVVVQRGDRVTFRQVQNDSPVVIAQGTF